MNRLTEVNRGGVADSFAYYWSNELLSAHYGGGPHMPFSEGQDPDLDTTDTVDPNAGYQPPETAEAEPPPPPDDTPPSDPTADTTPVPGSTPPSDTPPAEDPAKGQKTVEDYLGDSNLGPSDGPSPDLPTGRRVTYALDKAGNRTSVTDNVNGNAIYAPNNLNQYTSVDGSSVINGPEHEIQSYNSISYHYINDEHLKTVTSGSNRYDLFYDTLGRCVKRVLNRATTYYIYDREKPILEYRSSDLSRPAKNIYGKGIDEILMRYDPSFSPAVTYYYQQDHEGSVTHLLNTSGNVIESYKYDAFGAPAIYDGNGTPLSSSAYSNRFLFTGREYTNLFGFYEYRARAYNPMLGRFMSEDPKLFDAGDYNLFRYCHNDPLDLTDPTGLDGVSNGDGTYHFMMRTDIVPNMVGGHVVDSHDSPRQCAGAAQFLTGTRTPDGKWHDAPPARHDGWTQGARVNKDTPNGTMIARRWENGTYPNKEDWSVVNEKMRYNPKASTSNLKLEQTIQKGTQEAQAISAQHQHAQED